MCTKEVLANALATDPASATDHGKAIAIQSVGKHNNSLLLFGAGRMGKRALAGLRGCGVEPLAFIDNNEALWGTKVDGLVVIAPRVAAAEYRDRATFVITTVAPVKSQLLSYGIQPISYASAACLFPKLLPHYSLDTPNAILSDAQEILNAFDLWTDDASRREYVSQVQWRLIPDSAEVPPYLDPNEVYFPSNLVQLTESEVFVDCGAFDGDTLREFLKRTGQKFDEYIAIEPDPINFRKLADYRDSLATAVRDKVIVKPVAVGSTRAKVSFDASGNAGSAVGTGDQIIDCLPLDDIVAGCSPTYLKFDVEGFEVHAINGAHQTIGRHRPILAICSYHRQNDLWKLPALVKSICSDYCFFLRRYSDYCWEQLCYAIPPERVVGRN